METNRQKKIAGLLQQDLGDILGRAVQNGGLTNLILSVTKVAITVDLTLAKVYISVFPSEQASETSTEKNARFEFFLGRFPRIPLPDRALSQGRRKPYRES